MVNETETNRFAFERAAKERRIIMPFINAKISKAITKEQETQIKTMFGEAITTIPGKSENWLMVGLEPELSLKQCLVFLTSCVSLLV